MLKNINFKYLVLSFFLGVLVHITQINYFSKNLDFVSPKKTSIDINSAVLTNQSHRFHYEKWLETNRIGLAKANNDKVYEAVLESEYLAHKISLLCVIFFIRNQNSSKTFIPHCNKVVFIGNPTSTDPLTSFRIPEVDKWNGFVRLIPLLLKSHYPKYKWYAFISEDTFLIAENLRYFLSILDIKKFNYLGRPSTYESHVFHSLQTGIFMNRKTLKSLLSYVWLDEGGESDNNDTDQNIDNTNNINDQKINSESSTTAKLNRASASTENVDGPMQAYGLKRSGKCLFTDNLDVGLGKCLKRMGVAAMEVDTWKQHSFTDLPVGLYLSYLSQHTSVLSHFVDILTGNDGKEKALSKHLITFANAEGYSRDIMKYLVYRWKPWTDHPSTSNNYIYSG